MLALVYLYRDVLLSRTFGIMKYTRANLKKLEELCSHLGYKVRYEQGHFQSGYCRVESRKILVVNKFFDVEGRVNCLIDLIPELPTDEKALEEGQLKFYKQVIRIEKEKIPELLES
jgi:hypothetical protein